MRDEIWPFDDVWGDEKESVIDYLRAIYMDNKQVYFKRRSEKNLEKEVEILLSVS